MAIVSTLFFKIAFDYLNWNWAFLQTNRNKLAYSTKLGYTIVNNKAKRTSFLHNVCTLCTSSYRTVFCLLYNIMRKEINESSLVYLVGPSRWGIKELKDLVLFPAGSSVLFSLCLYIYIVYFRTWNDFWRPETRTPHNRPSTVSHRHRRIMPQWYVVDVVSLSAPISTALNIRDQCNVCPKGLIR